MAGEGDEEAGWERPQMVAEAEVGGRAICLLSLLQVIVVCVTMSVEIALIMGVGGPKHRTSLLWVSPFTSIISVCLVLCRYCVDNNPMMTWFVYAMTVGFSVLHIGSSTFHLLKALNGWKLKNFLINYPLIYAVCILVFVIIHMSYLVEDMS
ncbi:PREDICTED: uncharacterized protein LOC105955940 [Erythranthe guttata]|uniref:uncharacterized protein LOC105955940 n=1 Tax=Erythranthe guttata TaxID=4155 RepID=UPI00064D7B5D|nr:PREDICTED: uncharacterized protein LOC105955940 [Erythranthe guttata]|eukprot:XP_012835201.1 PREDICTED: uncharacterized protein LOC105955940 [Erythranthe guttata]